MWVIIRFFGLLLFWNQWLKFKQWLYEHRAKNKVKIKDHEPFDIINNRKILSSSTYVCVPLKRSSQFRIHKETNWDKLFKAWALVYENETGDKNFDEVAFIESDSKAFAKELGENQRAREIILELLEMDGARISADSAYLEIQMKGVKLDTDHHKVLIVELAEWLDSLPSKSHSIFKDPSHYKILAAEFVFTGIAFYGATSWVLNYFAGDLLETNYLLSKSIILAIVLGLSMILFNFVLLRNSSRGHRLLYENLLYIVIGVPLASFFLVSDANQSWDRNEPLKYEVPVTRHWVKGHDYTSWYYRSRYGWRPSYFARRDEYYLLVDLSSVGLSKSKRVNISRSEYLSDPTTVTLIIGQGYYNQKYLKRLTLN